MAEPNNAEYMLYSSPFSLYSMMARHTIMLGPTTEGAKPPRKIDVTFINRIKESNLDEDYIVKVNPKGQVPAMTGNVLDKPLTDSSSISLYLAEKHYPAMLPEKHEKIIRDLLERINNVPGLSYSKKPTAEQTKFNRSPVEDILKRTDLNPEYRAALEAKLEFHNKNNGIAFQPPTVAKARSDLQAIFTEVVKHRKQSGASESDSVWTFGPDVGPTVLDSHLLPVVLRCIDAGNGELVPQELQRWAMTLSKSPLWQKVMHGRPTLWEKSMGPQEDMKEFMSL